jgi:hypothetical protein
LHPLGVERTYTKVLVENLKRWFSFTPAGSFTLSGLHVITVIIPTKAQ